MNSLQVRYYPYGVSGYDSLIISQSKISHSELLPNNKIRLIECDIDEKWMMVKERDLNSEEWISLNLDGLKKHDIVDMNENGERWEGDSLNGIPYGYGSIYNENNQVIYDGFLVEGMKICFGSIYYGDVDIVEYEGCFHHDLRYGFGKLYDKKKELIYEGEICNNNPSERNKIILKEKMDEHLIHFNTEEIIIDTRYDSNLEYFKLIDYPYLRKIVFNDRCLQHVKEVELSSRGLFVLMNRSS